jgi:3-hydroxyisobutyrate dehydrogenase-like beta-hydroxyacid dehydrogenase
MQGGCERGFHMAANRKPIIGFIGFGEVGCCLSERMQTCGGQIFAYDKFANKVTKVAEQIRIPLFKSLEELVRSSNLILSCVWPDAAIDVAIEAASFLSSDKIYCDMNSISPERTSQIQKIISFTGAGFVKIAIMAAIPDRGNKAPLLAGGAQAKEVTEILKDLGLIIENFSSDPRHPAAMKILRSICLKGIVALAYEMLRGAERYGIADQILESASETMGKESFKDTVNAWLTSTAIHGRRRAKEMEGAVETLREAGINPVMSLATKEVFEEIANAGLEQVFKGEIPDSFHKVLGKMREYNSSH